jgi:hypothetical protein
MAIQGLRKKMLSHAPEIGGVTTYNLHTRRKKVKRLSIDELIQHKTCFPIVIIPRGNDRSVIHAVAVVDDLIFYATQPYALRLCKESLEWICGNTGIYDIVLALRFKETCKTEKRMKRTMKKNS